MEENTNTNTNAGVVENTATDNNNPNSNDGDIVTMSKSDYEKSIQSASDKVRTEYAKKMKKLEDDIIKYKPVEKTEDQIQLETRLAALEQKEKDAELREKRLNLNAALQKSNIDLSIADFLKDEIDVDSFVKILDSFMNSKITQSGYVPTGHQNNKGVTRDDWVKMSWDDKAKLKETDPELVKQLTGVKY